MKIDELQKQLEGLGYYCYQKNGILFSGIKGDSGPTQDTFVLNNTFSISLSEKILINYTIGQISFDKEFESKKKLLNFIKETFPLK